MKIGFSLFRLMLALAVFGVLAVALYGQATDSVVVGAVTDPSGAAVPNTKITAANKDTGVKYDTITDVAGEYRINNIPVGGYDVTAAASGFVTKKVTDLQLQLNRTGTANFALTVAPVNTTVIVEVQAASAPIDTATAQIQNTFDSKTILDVAPASNGLQSWNLSLLSAGVGSQGGVGNGTGPSIGGQRPTNNNFNVEGVDNNSHYSTGPIAYIPNEAVSQFTILQNHFSGEFGGSSGGIFNLIVKSGTNQVHGTVYEYLQNRNLNAVDALMVQQKTYTNPRYDSSRLGGNVGGPVVKNKLFYFGDFEYLPVGQSTTPHQIVYSPTAAGYQALDTMGGISKTNLQVLEQYLPPATEQTKTIQVGGVSIPVGSLSIVAPNYSNGYVGVGGADWNIGDRDQVRGRYVYNRSSGIDAVAALPAFFTMRPNLTNVVTLTEIHGFSATAENELRLSFNRNNNNATAGNFNFPGLNAFPNIQISDINLQLGPDPSAPSGTIQNVAQAADNFVKTAGRHTFKAGFDFHDVILSSFFVQYSRGNYQYSDLDHYLRDVTPDVLGTRSVGTGGGVPIGFLQSSAYFNDDFRVSRNLTLNLSVRYEYVTVPVVSRAQQYSALASVPGVIDLGEPQPMKNDWSPRVGFAYSPGKGGLWVVRGGFSRAFDNTYGNLNANDAPSYYQVTNNAVINSGTPAFLANGGLPGTFPPLPSTPAAARAVLAAYTYDQTRPYALNYTLGVQRLLGKDYTLEARYIGTKGVHLWVQDELNRIATVTATQNIPTFVTMPSASVLAALPLTLGQLRALPNNPWAQYGIGGTITAFHPVGNSDYNGLALQMTKRYSKNFTYIAAYTWSHNIDDSSASLNTTVLTPRRAQDFEDMSAEKASSMLDRRHRLTLTGIYDFRAFQGRNWLLRNVVSNWNGSMIYTYESPEYATVQSNVDANLNNDSVGDRAIVNPAGPANLSTGVTGYNAAGQSVAAGSSSIVAYVANSSNARYIAAALGAYANAGRNTFPLAPINNFDAALLKSIRITERVHTEIGAQFYNLLNHAQFTAGPLNDVSFRKYITSRNFLIPGNTSFGQIDQFYSSNSRQIQIVARLIF